MNRTKFGFPLMVIALSSAACGSGDKKPSDTAAAQATNPEGAAMQQGMDALYKNNDPYTAEQSFREILRTNPTHYGATYQLAASLDREGKPAEARPIWEKVVQAAQAANDTSTLATARARLAAPDTVGEAALMASGLHMLYAENNPTGAVDQFKKVLERKPTHYGATYQLASALDKAGRRAEARPLWDKVLKMATDAKDDSTAAKAKGRLAEKS